MSVQAPPRSAPSFRTDVLPVLTRNCADAKGCHGADRSDSVELDLTPDTAYRELVGHVSDVRPLALRVNPEHADRSFLLDKLSGRLRQDEGKRMPLDPDTGVPVDPNPITPKFIDDILIPWIAAGAKDD